MKNNFKRFPGLCSIKVEKKLPKSLADFKLDIELFLLENNGFDSVEAELLIEEHPRIIKREFDSMTLVIEYSEYGYNSRIKGLVNKLLK